MKVVPCYVKWNSVVSSSGLYSYRSNIGAGRYHSLDCPQNSRRNSMKYEGTNGPNSEDDLKVASVKDI